MWKEYFSFNKKERRGITILLVVIISQFAVIGFIPSLVQPEQSKLAEFERRVAVFEQKCKGSKERITKKRQGEAKYTNTTIDTVRRTTKIKNRSVVDSVQPLTPKQSLVDINSASQTQLLKINGIGKYYAKVIVKYRNLLGGFYSKKQLMEVYRMRKEHYVKIIRQIRVDKAKIKKIDINTSSFSSLLRHPYLNKEEVSGVVKLREKEKIKGIGQLIEANLLDSVKAQKIEPYLQF